MLRVNVKRFALVSCAVLLGSLPVLVGGGASASSPKPGSPVVLTDRGSVRGSTDGGVDSFLGMRYAKPPTGALRWRPPQLPTRWTGVADATKYGNRCPALESTNGPLSLTEDCLFLNVQRPRGTRGGARLPVYVFIHGGGNTNGSGDQHDGTKIVAESGVVVVTMNYRLGVFGWFAHPGLTDETGESGNYGFQDIEASLAWVHRNIAAFGGDPARVTVGGESAGAFSVCALLAAPGARGLFSAAMMQSGNCGSYTQQEAEGLGDEIAVAADCVDPATAVVCLRGRGVQALLDAAVDRTGDYVRGTPTLPLDPAAAVESGSVAKVPVVLGANLDEARTFLADWTGLSEEEYVGVLNNWFGADAPTYLALYPWPADSDQYTGTYLLSAIITDAGWLAFGGCATRTLADAFAKVTKVWVYEFAHRDGPGLRPEPVGYVWGAGHAAELPYLWPSFDNGTPIAATFDRGERRLAHDMVGYWGGFVQHHDPTGVRDLTRWPQYNARHQVLSLRAGGASTVLSDSAIVAEHHCDVWG